MSDSEKKELFSVLIVEDDRTSSTLVAQAMRYNMPDAQVLTARTLAEARQLLDQYHFHFFTLDLELPDGSGIDFLYDIQSRSPDSAVAIVTGTQLPEYREQAMAFGVLHFMEKPIDLNALLAITRSNREIVMPTNDSSGETAFFSGSLTSLTTLDIIQLKCLGHATVVLDFISRRRGRGRIFFRNGEIIHAHTATQRGVDAFNEIVSWRGGQIVEVPDAKEPERTIDADWQNLLLQAVQWSDEQKGAAAAE